MALHRINLEYVIPEGFKRVKRGKVKKRDYVALRSQDVWEEAFGYIGHSTKHIPTIRPIKKS